MGYPLRIAAVADIHLGSKRPALFLGSDSEWEQQTISVLEEAISKARDADAVDFIIAGDLFHSPNTSWRHLDRLLRLNDLDELAVRVTPGMGHDAKMDDLSDSPLQLLDWLSSEISTIAPFGMYTERWDVSYLGPPEDPCTGIVAVCPPFMMRQQFLNYWSSDPSGLPLGDVMVVHGPIIHEGPPQLPHVEPGEITVPYKLVICGDIHVPWHYEDIIRGTTWVSPGSIIAHTRAEAEHQPELVIAEFDTDNNKLVKVECIPLGEPRRHLYGTAKTEVESDSIISTLSQALAEDADDDTPSYVNLVHEVARRAELTDEQLAYLNDKIEGRETEVSGT